MKTLNKKFIHVNVNPNPLTRKTNSIEMHDIKYQPSHHHKSTVILGNGTQIKKTMSIRPLTVLLF